MSKRKSIDLVNLILSLSKSEKKNFKLMAKKAGRAQVLYLDLYKHIEYYKKYDEKLIFKKLPNIKRSQLSNLKANLYKQVLRSLRDIHKENYLEIKAREQFDFAKVLYSKGLYNASLKMLEKVKTLASNINKQPLEYLALSFEKHIESQHVTGSMSPKADSLAFESSQIIDQLQLTDKLSNLALLMYGKYLQLGIVRSVAEKESLEKYFTSLLPSIEINSLDFYQKLYIFQAYVWYYTMTQDFAKYYLYAQRWVDLFDTHPHMQRIETSIYIKGLHNVLNALYMSDKPLRFEVALPSLSKFNEEGQFVLSINESSQLELFQQIHNLNLIFFKANYEQGVKSIKFLEDELEQNPEKWDLNRRIVFHYKLACVYFGANDLDKTVLHLNKITNTYYPNFKEDIQCFARILKLIAHFDMGDEDLVSYDVRSVFRFLLKMQELQAVQNEILRFIRKTPMIKTENVIQEFILLKTRLLIHEEDMLERRPFLYLDIISWLESKINKVSIAEAIVARRKRKIQRA